MKSYILIISIFIFALAGCANESMKNSKGNIAAKVNGEEITKRQVEFLAQRYIRPDMTPEQYANIRRQILTELVQTELLAAKAKKSGLDKTSDYAMAIYTSNSKVLAGLAEKEMIEKLGDVSQEEVNTIIEQNPPLFSERKFFIYDEIVFPGVDIKFLESIGKMANNNAGLGQILDILNTKNIKYIKRERMLFVEQIPVPILQILYKVKPNIPQVARQGNKISAIINLRQVIAAPIVGEDAKRVATRILMTNKQNEAISKEMRELLNNATITYYDEYEKNKIGNKELTLLPVPDTKRVAAKERNSIIVGGLFTGSIILSMMILTASMRILFNKLWLPVMFKKSDIDVSEKEAMYYQSSFPIGQRVLLYLIMIAVGLILIMDIMLIFGKISILLLLAMIIGGVAAGYIMSRLYRMGIVFGWSRNIYFIIVILLSMPIFASFMILKRLVASLV
jgi:EpsD family peptidyl-prolyl cis-trans isomerase